MISINPQEMSERDNYKFLIGSVIPRPVAVINSLSREQILNTAPFSYFNIVTSNPPILSVAIQRKSGAMKDTSRNIVETGEAVVHIADAENINDINQTAANLGPEESEILTTELTLSASDMIQVPMLNEPKIKMETTLFKHIPITLGQDVTADLLLLQVVKYHIADDLYQNGRINPELLNPMSRLAGNDYAALGKQLTLTRPE
ncbi:flavin reductase family protein [Vagococcus vulneris]|uniref:Flavin reductase like domain-containing protein n=1 Tax=Vagococcus vulneris TaxID=1977869 RepID=A0A430A080_9ENTE|nr:flavin reductase family protein [Vagococcus vulneris]RST99746.1 hypothetical protein CBF37_03205 [Vagococcus vulneris]